MKRFSTEPATITNIESTESGDVVYLSFRNAEIYEFDLFQLGSLPVKGITFSGSRVQGSVKLLGKCRKSAGDTVPKLPADQHNWWHNRA